VSASQQAAPSQGGWTGAIRRQLARRLPLEELLPTSQPAYVHSWVYLFGAITIAALIWVVASGVVLAFFGPQWWHQSSIGRFFNSLHFWGVQIFFVFMVLHLWAQFWAAGWRDGRGLTWVIGVVTFLASVVTGFTGYISQQNFAAQWIAVNAKDAVNGTGMGALFNPLNFGQAYGIHVMLLPVSVVLLTAAHIAMVRMNGIVLPIGAPAAAAPDAATSSGARS
jgi:quinol-cytochrome oxidoreductase complex cytochrome b subunit